MFDFQITITFNFDMGEGSKTFSLWFPDSRDCFLENRKLVSHSNGNCMFKNKMFRQTIVKKARFIFWNAPYYAKILPSSKIACLFSFMKYSTISWEKPTGRNNAVIWERKKDSRMEKLSLKNLWAIYHQTSIR